MGEWRGCGHKACRMPTGFTFWYKSGYEASAAAKQKDKGERALPAHSVELSRSVTTYKALQGKFYSERRRKQLILEILFLFILRNNSLYSLEC